jgi:streptogramin lyase
MRPLRAPQPSCGGSYLPSVIRLDPASGMWTVLTEGGLMQKPFGVAVEADGSILITDMARVIRVDPLTGDQTIFTSGLTLQIAQGITIVPKKINK